MALLRRGLAKRNLAVITASWTMMRPFTAATRTYFALYFLELGADPAKIGIITMAGSATLALTRIIGGYLADALGRKKLIVTMTMVYALASLLYAFAKSWTWLLAAEVISSAALLYQPAIFAIMADSLPPDSRARGISAARTIASISSLAGPPAAALLVNSRGLVPAVRMLYIARSAAIFLAGLGRLALVETLTTKKKVELGSVFREYREALSWIRGDLGKLIAINSSAVAAYGLADPFIQIYAVREVGISPEAWGVVSTAVRVETMVSFLVSGYMADRLGRNISLALAYGFSSAGLLALLVVPRDSFTAVLVSQLIYAAFAFGPARFALFADLTPTEARGKLTAVRGLVEDGAFSLASALGGSVYSVSPFVDLGLSAIGLALSALAALKALPRVGSIEKFSEEPESREAWHLPQRVSSQLPRNSPQRA